MKSILLALILCMSLTTSLMGSSSKDCDLSASELLDRLPYQEIEGVRVSSAISWDKRLAYEAQYATRDLRTQKDINALIWREIIGNESTGQGMGRLALGNGYYELRHSAGARVYIKVRNKDGVKYLTVCGKATKNGSANDHKVFRIMREVFPDFPDPPKGMSVTK